MSKPTVFLSAATTDLKKWCDELDRAFSRARFRVLTQDHGLGAAPKNVKGLPSETVTDSDCTIHLAGAPRRCRVSLGDFAAYETSATFTDLQSIFL